jgi:hypothetical protein
MYLTKQENYGRGRESTSENEKIVKGIFKELKIDDEYWAFEEKRYDSICAKIQNLSNRLPTAIFQETADVMYHRKR